MACAVVANAENRVLLGLGEDFDVWGLPGGHVEPGEMPAEAASRVTDEGLGVEVTIDSLIGRYTRLGGLGDSLSWAYSARVNGTPVPDGIETVDVGWLDVTSLPPMLWWNRDLARTLCREQPTG